MTKEEKKKKFQSLLTRILLGAFIILFYGAFALQDILNIDIDKVMSVLMVGFYVPAIVFSGIRAKQLARPPAGWAIGSFFGLLIPSIVLFFLGKKPKALLEERLQKRLLENKQKKVEKAILSFAKQNRGFITVANAAMEADIPMEEAQKLLDEFVRKGFAQMEVKASGSLMYVFQDFLVDD